jgi:neural Wiskott-Aldrich syndrome protein
MASELPPIYSPEDTNYPASSDDGEQLYLSTAAALDTSLQLLISPSSLDTLGFQNGFVGAEGEHAAIEGEVQIKSLPGRWQKVYASSSFLCTS